MSHARTQLLPVRPILPSAALLAWVAVPSTVLILLAGGVRLSSNWPVPAERWASEGVLAVQVLLASLLPATLLSSWRTTVTSVCLGAVPLTAGAVLDHRPWPALGLAWLWLALWLIGLRLLAFAVKGRRGSGVGWALAPTLTTAYLLQVYAILEWRDPAQALGLPLPVATSTFLHWGVWIAPVALVGAGSSLALVPRRRGLSGS